MKKEEMGKALRTVEQIDKEITELQDQLENAEGTKTEVYTRIVGYYRSVANWNKGKREEYNYRKLFSEPGDMLKPETARPVEKARAADHRADTAGAARERGEKISSYTFFYRQTCPNCPPVKEYLASLAIAGDSLNVDTEEGMKRASLYQVLAAPTVIFFDSQGLEVTRVHNTETLNAIFNASAVSLS